MPVQSARVVLVSPQGRVALIRRRRAGREYWSFPGGGIKRGEAPRRAARREVAEELGLDVSPHRLLAVASGHALFLVTIDGEPRLRMRGPEVARRSRRDRYRPEWVALDRLSALDVRPRSARAALTPLASGATALPGAVHPATPPSAAPAAPPPEPTDVEPTDVEPTDVEPTDVERPLTGPAPDCAAEPTGDVAVAVPPSAPVPAPARWRRAGRWFATFRRRR